MFAITPSTLDAVEKLYSKNSKLVQKIVKNNLSNFDQIKVAKIFTRLNLKAQDLRSVAAPCFLKRATQCFIGRIFIALFFRKKAGEMVHAVISNYQSTKIIQFSKQLDQRDELILSKEEQKKVVFLASHSALKGEIKHKIRHRVWKRWKSLQLPKQAFDYVYPINSNTWKKLLSDQRIDKYIAQSNDKLELQSDNSVSSLKSSLESGTINIEKSTSDNVESRAASLDVSANLVPVIIKQEALFQDLEHSQTLPHYLTSIEDFLIYLLDSKDKNVIINQLSKLTANYISNNQGEKKKNVEKHKSIFLSWMEAFSKTHDNPKEVSKDDYLIDFTKYPRIKPFVPLLEYLPLLTRRYKKFQKIFKNEKDKLSKIDFRNLEALLQLDKIDKTDTVEKKIASLILPLVSQFMASIHEKVNNKELRAEWLDFCKTVAASWDNPFYSGLLALTEWTPEAGIKFFIKTSLSNYEPMVKALQKTLECLPQCEKELSEIAEKKIKKQKAWIEIYAKQIKTESNSQQLETLKEKLQKSKQRMKDLKAYQKGLAEALKLKVEEVQNQIKWENTKEAKELDASVGKIHQEIYKKVLVAWLDHHSIKKFIKCIRVYRKITIKLKDLLSAEFLGESKKEEAIANIRHLVIELMVNLIIAAQQYASEVKPLSIEADIFSIIDCQLQEMHYKKDSLNFTSTTWQNLIAPIAEQMLKAPGLFAT